MAKEEKDLEDILLNREDETPSRVKKENPIIKVAKLTGRTISSLKTKKKEKRLAKAYEKYNKNYRNMRRALIEANTLKTAQEKGNDVSQSEVVEAFDVVASYNKKLAKYAVRLLTDDIEKAVQTQKARPLRIPRLLLGKMKPIVKWIARIRDKKKNKKLQKELAKDIKKGTRDYIEDSIEGALFNDSDAGSLRKEVDAKVIQGLATDKKAETFEEKIANLRRFISKDGKEPLFEEEKIGTEEKTSTDVPPVEPVASIEKEDKTITTEDLLNSLGKKTAPIEEEEISDTVENTSEEPKKEEEEPVKEQPSVTVEDLKRNLGSESKPEEKVADADELSVKTVPVNETVEAANKEVVEEDSELVKETEELASARRREINAITTLGKTIEGLERQLENTNDPETKEALQTYIKLLNNDLTDIINRSIERSTKKEVVAEEPKAVEVKPAEEAIAVEANEEQKNESLEEEKDSFIEPIVVEPKEEKIVEETAVTPVEETKIDSMAHVEVKESETMRAQQVSTPTVFTLTLDDIKRLEKNNADLDSEITDLTRRKEELLDQKELLERAIALGKEVEAKRETVEQLTKDTTGLEGEVDVLGREAAPYVTRITK